MSFRIMTGNKSVVSVVVFVLILCFLLCGCSGGTAVNKDDGDGQETIGSTAAESTGPSETTSLISDGGETEPQSNTKPQDVTKPDDDFATEDSVSATEYSEMPTDSATATYPGGGGDDVPSTQPPNVPTDGTVATIPENEGDNIPSYGIELPDDNWD